jgi:hypothetical protein
MFDRLLNGALWLTVMGMITATAAAGLLLSYRGLFDVCAGRIPGGAVAVLVGITLGGASYMLARNCNDLMDR